MSPYGENTILTWETSSSILFADILLIIAGSVVMAMESAHRNRDEQEK